MYPARAHSCTRSLASLPYAPSETPLRTHTYIHTHAHTHAHQTQTSCMELSLPQFYEVSRFDARPDGLSCACALACACVCAVRARFVLNVTRTRWLLYCGVPRPRGIDAVVAQEMEKAKASMEFLS